jgi:hypothetical protein
MGIEEPKGSALWTEVSKSVPWPDTDEGRAGELGEAWNNSAVGFAAANDVKVSRARAAWQDNAGLGFATTAGHLFAAAGDGGENMRKLAGGAMDFAGVVGTAKARLASLIASNELAYLTAVGLPDGAGRGYMDEIVAKVTGWAGDIVKDAEKTIAGLSLDIAPSDQLRQAQEALGKDLGAALKALDPTTPAGMRQADAMSDLLERFQKDPGMAQQVIRDLGPEGITKLLFKLQSITDPRYAPMGRTIDEINAGQALQDKMGGGLAGMLATASPQLDREFGTKLAQSPWAASVLLEYMDRGDVQVGPELFAGMGTELQRQEQSNPTWVGTFDGMSHQFGSVNFGNFISPMGSYLKVADNNTANAQAAMGDEGLMSYLVTERMDYDKLSEQSGKVLDLATVQAANSSDDAQARAAADISSHVLDVVGQDETPGGEPIEPLDGVKGTVGGIVATYILDADRAAESGGDLTPGIHTWGDGTNPDGTRMLPYGRGLEGIQTPKYGINVDTAHLRNVLGDIAGDDGAKAAVSDATNRLNQFRLDQAAVSYAADPVAGKENLAFAAGNSASLKGFMVDGIVHGDIANAMSEAEERKKIAGYFTAPIDLIPVDKVPLYGEIFRDEVKDKLVEHITDDQAQAVAMNGQTLLQDSVNSVKVQALYSMHQQNVPIGFDWPMADGRAVPPGELSQQQINDLVWRMNAQSLPATVATEADQSWGDHIQTYEKPPHPN